jgi:hypothetical protein
MCHECFYYNNHSIRGGPFVKPTFEALLVDIEDRQSDLLHTVVRWLRKGTARFLSLIEEIKRFYEI